MLQQILIHTPLYVWAILAFLIYRGVIASTNREVEFNKLFIIPAIMLLLSLQDLAGKFGLSGMILAAWSAGAAVSAALVWKLSAARVVAGNRPGSVLLRGSWLPLALMMAVFCTKYIAAVLLALNPQAHQNALFVVLVSSLFGIINGIFLGRLVRDTTAYHQAHARSGMTSAVA
jgi:hypothetical protein